MVGGKLHNGETPSAEDHLTHGLKNSTRLTRFLNSTKKKSLR